MPNTDSRLIDALSSQLESMKIKSLRNFSQKKRPWWVSSFQTRRNILAESEDLQMLGICGKLIRKKYGEC